MANQTYPNVVLEAKLEDMYSTRVAMNDFLTIDNNLQAKAGNKIKINRYSVSGSVEDLSMGNGNSGSIETVIKSAEYTVGYTQGKAAYYDEQFNEDPLVVDTLLQGMAAKMANDNATKIFAELQKSHTWSISASLGFDAFADAVAALNVEEGEKFFAYIHPSDLATLRKALNSDLKYVEAFARTGYVGTVCGCDVIINKAATKGEVELFSREAVTLFNKKGIEVEQNRDADHRKNELYIRKDCVVALTNETKAIRMFFGLSDFITTSADVSTTASTTSGSTVLHVYAAPAGYKWVYKAGSSAATPTFGTAYTTGVTAITTLDTTIAMSTNTHLTVVLVNATDNKPVAYKDLTGDDLHIGA